MTKRSWRSSPERTLSGLLRIVPLGLAVCVASALPGFAIEEGSDPTLANGGVSSRESWTDLMRQAREFRRLGQLREAEDRLLEAITIGDHHGPPGQRVGTAFYQLEQIAAIYETRGQREDLLRLGPTLVLIGGQLRGPSDPSVRQHRASLVAALAADGDDAATKAALEQALPGTRGAERAQYQLSLASLALQGEVPDDAEAALADVLAAIPPTATDPEQQGLRIGALLLMAQLRSLQQRENEAEPLLLEAVAAASTNAPASIGEARAKNTLAEFYVEQDRGADAEVLAREALAVVASGKDPSPLLVAILDTLASSLALQQRNDETEKVYERGLDLAERQPGEAADNLRVHYAAWLRSQGRGPDAQGIAPPTRATEAPGEAPAPAG